ncbi:MAG: hypothetical protein QOJ99_3129 [Bryobacterales bacterium]|jgi:hypothetical protein|nr:hypothetical protein [Bryobacterales bacterium]
MPGYLDQYGAGEEQRNRIIIRTVVSTLTIVILGTLFWYLLRNHHQEGVVKNFLTAVRKGDYQGAYRAWGCSGPGACSGYTYDSFLSDWGPAAKSTSQPALDFKPDPSALGIIDSESCNNGVLLTVEVNQARTEKLWVDRKSDAINYAPYPICPHKNPWSIMLHRTVGKLRKPLLK